MTIEQAVERAEIIPRRAVDAAIKMVFRMREIRDKKWKSNTRNTVNIIN